MMWIETMMWIEKVPTEKEMIGDKSAISTENTTATPPWFTIFNPYYGPRQTVTYPFHPFPASEFPPNSPWEDCVIIAHAGIEPFAAAAGFSGAHQFLKHLIRQAATGAR